MKKIQLLLIKSWGSIRKFIYNYPILWFLIGYGLCFFTYPFYYKRIIVGGICFSFSVINIIANYNKERPIFKWIFWDCLPSVFFIFLSMLLVLVSLQAYEFSDDLSSDLFGFVFFGVLDVLILVGILDYIDSYIRIGNFELIVFIYYILALIMTVFFIYQLFRKDKIKEVLRTRVGTIIILFLFSKIFIVILGPLLSLLKPL